MPYLRSRLGSANHRRKAGGESGLPMLARVTASIRAAMAVALLLAAAAAVAPAAELEQPMPLDQALEQLKTYDYGQGDEALRAIEMHLGRLATDSDKTELARRLAAILAGDKTPAAAKTFICQQFLVIGGEAQVPLLAKMLEDPQTAEIARYTLEAIPGEASLAAIRAALDRLKDMPLVGAINSLGIRRDAQAVDRLIKLLANSDPLVAGAAAEALGKIATRPAAAALGQAQVPARSTAALHNAQLQCAERLAADDAASAATLYQQVWASNRPPRWRVAGLVGLTKVAPDKASPVVLESLAADDPVVQATAVRLTRQLPGPQVTAALLQRLEQLDVTGQVLVLGILAERGDRSAAAAVIARIDDKNVPVQVAAIQAIGPLGDASMADRLAQLAATGAGTVQQAARASLARLSGPDVEPKLLAMISTGEPALRVEVCRALAARRAAAAAPALLKAAGGAEPSVRVAALDALAAVAGGDSYTELIRLAVEAPTPQDAEAAEHAILAAGERLPTLAERVSPVLAALLSAPAAARPGLVRILGRFGGPEALQAVRARLADADAALRDAAVRALVAWPDPSAADDLLDVARTAESTTHRVLAVRGYLRLAAELKDETARLKMLEQVRPIATNVQSKRMLLGALSEAADSAALHVVVAMLDDAEVRDEAAVAALKIARGLVRKDRAAVGAAMRKLLALSRDKALADQAAALEEEASRAPTPGAGQKALQFDKKRSDEQKARLAGRPPQGYRLACYLDCGPDTADGAQGGPSLRLVTGMPYYWPDAESLADVRFGTVAFGSQVVFEAAGLDPKKSYQMGFTWWDCDHDTRIQSIAATGAKGQGDAMLLEKTQLPSGRKGQGPDGKTLLIPPAIYADGSLRIVFRNESQPNAVVCELWLWESEKPATPQ